MSFALIKQHAAVEVRKAYERQALTELEAYHQEQLDNGPLKDMLKGEVRGARAGSVGGMRDYLPARPYQIRLDALGNVVSGDDEAKESGRNIADEQIVRALLAGEENPISIGENYRGEYAFAKGSKVESDEKTTLAITYFPLTQAEKAVTASGQEINRLNGRIIAWNAVFFLIGLVIWFVWQRYVKAHFIQSS